MDYRFQPLEVAAAVRAVSAPVAEVVVGAAEKMVESSQEGAVAKAAELSLAEAKVAALWVEPQPQAVGAATRRSAAANHYQTLLRRIRPVRVQKRLACIL